MKEIWKDISGYEGYYQISNLGRVKSLDRMVLAGYGSLTSTKGQIMTPNVKHGYDTVGLCKEGGRSWRLIHRLMAIEFIPNPKNYPIINHIDEDKGNNNVNNLEWCTYQHNNTYGNRLVGWGGRVRDKLKKPVHQYTLEGVFVKRYDAMIDATKDGFRQGAISSCCNGKVNTHQGFIWKFEGDD